MERLFSLFLACRAAMFHYAKCNVLYADVLRSLDAGLRSSDVHQGSDRQDEPSTHLVHDLTASVSPSLASVRTGKATSGSS